MIATPPTISDESEDEDEDAYTYNTIMSIQLDGKVLGYASPKKVEHIVQTLRHYKVKGLNNIPLNLEIGHVSPSRGGQYPGLFLFSGPCRMTRPVKYLATGETDMVGPFEQVYLNIACMNEDVVPGVTTHMEVVPTNILSIVANMTPFSDFNQSPRNMYQCQVSHSGMFIDD